MSPGSEEDSIALDQRARPCGAQNQVHSNKRFTRYTTPTHNKEQREMRIPKSESFRNCCATVRRPCRSALDATWLFVSSTFFVALLVWEGSVKASVGHAHSRRAAGLPLSGCLLSA